MIFCYNRITIMEDYCMNIDKLGVFFEEQKEVLNCGDGYLELELGELTKAIAFIPDYILSHIEEKMVSMKSILMEQPQLRLADENYLRTYRNCVKYLTHFHDSISEEIVSLNNDIYSNLLFAFPITNDIWELHNHYGFSFSYEKKRKSMKEECGELLASFKSAPLPTFFDIIFSHSKQPSQHEIIFKNLEIIFNQLFESRSFAYIPNPEDIEQYYYSIERYLDKIIDCCHEIAMLKLLASSYIATNADLAELSKEYKWIEKEIIAYKDNNAVSSISTLLLSEISYLNDNKYYFKKCSLCGNIFITKRSKAVYCNNPNPKYNNKTCVNVIKILKNKTKDPVYLHFNTLSKEYSNWKIDQPKRYEKIYEENPLVDEEIVKLHKEWLIKSNSILFDYQFGKISFDEAMERIRLPEIPERSPIWSKIVNDYKDSIKVSEKASKKKSHKQ